MNEPDAHHPPSPTLPHKGGEGGPRPFIDAEGTEAALLLPPPLRGRVGEGGAGPAAAPILGWIADELAPALDGSGAAEIAALLAALDGRFVPPGPSGAPTRGRAEVLPTGRNFYAVDTRAIPTEAAWRLGRAAAEALVMRYLQDEGRMAALDRDLRLGHGEHAYRRRRHRRRSLALIGAEPVWEAGTGRVTGFRVLTLAELKRPRVDVTLADLRPCSATPFPSRST